MIYLNDRDGGEKQLIVRIDLYFKEWNEIRVVKFERT